MKRVASLPEPIKETTFFGGVEYALGESGAVYIVGSSVVNVKIRKTQNQRLWDLIKAGYSIPEIKDLLALSRYQLIGIILDLHGEVESWQDAMQYDNN